MKPLLIFDLALVAITRAPRSLQLGRYWGRTDMAQAVQFGRDCPAADIGREFIVK
jgi:hypothetical protein